MKPTVQSICSVGLFVLYNVTGAPVAAERKAAVAIRCDWIAS